MDRNHPVPTYPKDGTMVRLVRACGSKPQLRRRDKGKTNGQARKSLWIETSFGSMYNDCNKGQARKSLWIETFSFKF